MSSTLVFLHGGPGFKDYLEPYFSDLQTQKLECVFYNQRQGSNITIENLVSELHEKLSSNKNKCILIGHSWGGVLALEYFKRYPQQVAALVLMCTGLNIQHWMEYRSELKLLGLEEASPNKIFLSKEEAEQNPNFLDNMWKDFSEETFDSLFESYVKNYDLSDTLKTAKIPILLICCEKDLRFPLRIYNDFAQLNPKIQKLIIKEAGHFPFLLKENRSLIHKKILEFVADVEKEP